MLELVRCCAAFAMSYHLYRVGSSCLCCHAYRSLVVFNFRIWACAGSILGAYSVRSTKNTTLSRFIAARRPKTLLMNKWLRRLASEFLLDQPGDFLRDFKNHNLIVVSALFPVGDAPSLYFRLHLALSYVLQMAHKDLCEGKMGGSTLQTGRAGTVSFTDGEDKGRCAENVGVRFFGLKTLPRTFGPSERFGTSTPGEFAEKVRFV